MMLIVMMMIRKTRWETMILPLLLIIIKDTADLVIFDMVIVVLIISFMLKTIDY